MIKVYTVCITYSNFYKNVKENLTIPPCVRRGPVQKVEVAEVTRYEWVKYSETEILWKYTRNLTHEEIPSPEVKKKKTC